MLVGGVVVRAAIHDGGERVAARVVLLLGRFLRRPRGTCLSVLVGMFRYEWWVLDPSRENTVPFATRHEDLNRLRNLLLLRRVNLRHRRCEHPLERAHALKIPSPNFTLARRRFVVYRSTAVSQRLRRRRRGSHGRESHVAGPHNVLPGLGFGLVVVEARRVDHASQRMRLFLVDIVASTVDGALIAALIVAARRSSVASKLSRSRVLAVNDLLAAMATFVGWLAGHIAFFLVAGVLGAGDVLRVDRSGSHVVDVARFGFFGWEEEKETRGIVQAF